MKKIKTIKDLNKKTWYRLLKVVYVFFFLGLIVFVILIIYSLNIEPHKYIDNSKIKIICNYGNKNTYMAKDVDMYFSEYDFKKGYLSNSKREQLKELCQISESEIEQKLKAIFNDTDDGKNLFDVNPEYKTRGGFGYVLLYSIIALIIIIAVFKILKRIFYYIILGTIEPKKK